MLFYKIICLYCLIHLNDSIDLPIKLKNKYDTLKKKIKHFWKESKIEGLHLNIDEIEYPRGNETLRNIHTKLWNEYYECLKKRYSSFGPLKTLNPVALIAFEGTSVTIPCNICISPNDIHTIESINWFYRNTRNIYVDDTAVDLTENVVISPNDRALSLYNVQTFQEGLYWCKMADSLSTPHYLYVADKTEPTIAVQPITAPNSTHPQSPQIVLKYKLKIYSSWTTWSPCSVCNGVGIQIRYGYCTFSAMKFDKNDFIENQISLMNEDHHDWLNSMLNNDEKNLKQKIDNVLTVFQDKMPCRSRFTPKEIQEIPEIKIRNTEIMKKFCKIKCQRDVIFEIRDKNGRVLERANNSAGIYSTVQGMPEPRPSVQRITIYQKYGKSVKLKCPGNFNIDVPVTWKIGIKTVNPKIIKNESHKRIYVDSQQRIVIKNSRYADINIYSCWQRSVLVGTIRLEIAYDISYKLNNRIMMFTGIPIITVILYIFVQAWRRRGRSIK